MMVTLATTNYSVVMLQQYIMCAQLLSRATYRSQAAKSYEEHCASTNIVVSWSLTVVTHFSKVAKAMMKKEIIILNSLRI